MKNLIPQVPCLYLPDNKPLLQKKAIAVFAIDTLASAKSLFQELDENLRKVIFTEDDLDSNINFLSSLFPSFVALYVKKDKHFIYYCFEGEVERFLLTDDFCPPSDVKILIRRPL